MGLFKALSNFFQDETNNKQNTENLTITRNIPAKERSIEDVINEYGFKYYRWVPWEKDGQSAPYYEKHECTVIGDYLFVGFNPKKFFTGGFEKILSAIKEIINQDEDFDRYYCVCIDIRKDILTYSDIEKVCDKLSQLVQKIKTEKNERKIEYEEQKKYENDIISFEKITSIFSELPKLIYLDSLYYTLLHGLSDDEKDKICEVMQNGLNNISSGYWDFYKAYRKRKLSVSLDSVPALYPFITNLFHMSDFYVEYKDRFTFFFSLSDEERIHRIFDFIKEKNMERIHEFLQSLERDIKYAYDEKGRRKTDIKNFKPGDIVLGTVKRIKEFGAFVDIGGIDGLVHVSEISNGYVKHPSDVLHEGQEVAVFIKSISFDRKYFYLSIKKASLNLKNGTILPTEQKEQDKIQVSNVMNAVKEKIYDFYMRRSVAINEEINRRKEKNIMTKEGFDYLKKLCKTGELKEFISGYHSNKEYFSEHPKKTKEWNATETIGINKKGGIICIVVQEETEEEKKLKLILKKHEFNLITETYMQTKTKCISTPYRGPNVYGEDDTGDCTHYYKAIVTSYYGVKGNTKIFIKNSPISDLDFEQIESEFVKKIQGQK